MKKAILTVSFGTTHLDTMEKTIIPIEEEMAKAFPGWDVRRAFTSSIVMKKLREDPGIEIDNVEEALDRLKDEGYEDVIIQPTHIINGEEYEKLCSMAEPFEKGFHAFRIGNPLLTTSEDYFRTAKALCEVLPPQKEEQAVVLMGHGSEHFANAAYCELEYVFHDMGRTDVLIGTVEGYPALEQVISRLDSESYASVDDIILIPFMVVAGDHAENDMAGNGDESWKTLLGNKRYYVKCILTGIGEYPGIRKIFVRHAREAMENQAVQRLCLV